MKDNKGVTYSDIKEIDRSRLVDLFRSVEWDSANYPDRLQKAIAGSDSIFTAWDGDRLVGLVNALSDTAMTVYVHYMLIRPDYQNKGIGRKLLDMVKEKYRDFPKILLISQDGETGFYEKNGFFIPPKHNVMYFTQMAQ